jgi:hypothetical protein
MSQLAMLWDAGQRRMTRESRERLTELYVGVRDGYVAGNVATGKVKAKRDVTPSYARSPRPAIARSPAVRDAALARLAEAYPGIVKGVQ